MTIVIPPPEQKFNGPGFVYTVEYECGSALDTYDTIKGRYRTNILVHNNRAVKQIVFIKILSAMPKPTSVWLSRENPKIVIEPDGAVDIGCKQIGESLNLHNHEYSKGLVVILHQISGRERTPIPLDVRVSYTYFVDEGASKQVESIAGVFVPKIPMP